jgi:mannose-6-phosphate isomerase-like protein (cupin superfamily)
MPEPFAHRRLPVEPDAIAPDGSQVRLLLDLPPSEHHGGGGLAHFELAAGEVSTAVCHRTVEELWYVVEGRGEMWREQDGREETIPLQPGLALTIPLGTRFQFRSLGPEPLAAVATTMPCWPGEGEASIVVGAWKPTLP